MNNRTYEFRENDTVYVQDFRRDTGKRTEAIILEKLSPVTYNVRLKDGYVTKRHVNQIVRAGTIPPKRGEIGDAAKDNSNTVNDSGRSDNEKESIVKQKKKT